MHKVLTFKGGIHPLARMHHGKNLSNKQPIAVMPPPKQVVIPLLQHIGAPCKAVVQKGDRVKMGQRIGEPGGFVSAPVHASVSGEVIAVEERLVVSGAKVPCVVIENDFKDTPDESIRPLGTVDSLTVEQIDQAISQAGIVGMGGATFPEHIKLNIPPEKDVGVVIVNGAECEPFLTADHRLMLEAPERIVEGLRAAMKAAGVPIGYIGIEKNKPDAIRVMEKAVVHRPEIDVVPLETKYPQGAEKQLITAITGREVPSGKLPADAGAVVINAGTAAAIGQRLLEGLPLIQRVVTVTGSVKNPSNLLARIGTSFEQMLDFCGGVVGKPEKILSGGPMMGIAIYDTSVPVIKGTSGILVLDETLAKTQPEQNCISCGRCARACPMHLQPLFINAAAVNNRFDKAKALGAMDCIECGCCSYVCPAHRTLVQSIRLCKREIAAANQAKKG